MLSIPPALTELGLARELQAALQKLSAALPPALRADEQDVRQRIHIDSSPWEDPSSLSAVPNLQILQDALWKSRVVDVKHTVWHRPDLAPLRAQIHPYGLVAKAGNWYLIGRRGDHIAVISINRIVDVGVLACAFSRPADFDLVEFWKSYCQASLQNRPVYPVQVRARADLLPFLPWRLGEKVQVFVLEDSPPDSKGWIAIELRFEYFEQALRSLLALGCAVEVIEPIALRYTIQDYAAQILALYN
jgi:predicted DNA-binding transcriptional regulator YafY